MATTDMNAQIHIKDGNGNVNNIFPATKIANVEGLTAALNAKADTTTVTNQLSGKVDKETGKGLSTNDYTTAEKNKLSGIEAQANKTTVDSALSSSSENPVQNKVINTAIAGKADSSTVTALTSRVSDAESDIATQTSRIDNIVALPSGSTQGDAELMDIRVKADGTTASSAGAAVRDQVGSLQNSLDILSFIVSNDDLESGTWENGSKATSNKRLRTKSKINVFKGSAIIVKPNGLFVQIAQYTSENGSVDSVTNWFSDDRVITIDNEWITVIIANAETYNASTAIVVSDYHGKIYGINEARKADQTRFESLTSTFFKNTKSAIALLGDFERGGLELDGELSTQKYRVSSVSWITSDYDITISPNSGFKIGYVSNGTWSGWYTDNLTVPARTTFKLQTARVSENYSEVADVNEFTSSFLFKTSLMDATTDINTLKNDLDKVVIPVKYYNLESGSIGTNGSLSVDSKRCRTFDYIPYDSTMNIIRLDSNYKYGFHFYSAAKEHIGYTDWITDDSYDVGTIENCALVKIVISTITNQDIDVTVIPNVLNIKFDISRYISTVSRNTPQKYYYTGEKMPTSNSFDVEALFRFSYDGRIETSQDIEIIDNYMFVAFTGNVERINVYDLNNNELIAELPCTVYHGSSMQFSSEYYSSDDDFPLLYVGGWSDNLVSVLRITKGNTWNVQTVRTLKFPSDYGYYLSPSVDKTNNALYLYGHSINDMHSAEVMKISKWNLNNLSKNSDNTYTPQFVSVLESPNIGVFQGHKYFNNRLFIEATDADNESGNYNGRIVIVDPANGNIKSTIDLSKAIAEELEGIAYRITSDNSVEWYSTGFFSVLKLKF